MMHDSTTVIVDHNELTREVWNFKYLSQGAVLETWRFETRKTKRHKFQASHYNGNVWQRIDKRQNRCDEPKPPQSVIDEALNNFRQSIKMADTE